MRLLLIYTLLLCLCFTAAAQSTDAIVSSIEFSGDHNMKKKFLLKSMNIEVNKSANWEQILLEKELLNQLEQVQYVNVDVDTLADGSLRVRIEIIPPISAPVSNITFSGDHKMDEDFLLGRMNTKIHKPATWKQIIVDKDRLTRLNGIQYVNLNVDTLVDGSIQLQVEVFPQKTIKPFIGLGHTKDNSWYQIGAAEYNFNRKNKTLLGYFLSQDGRPNGKIRFNNPYYNGKNWGYSINAFHNASREPLYFENSTVTYNYDLTGIGLGGTNQFGFIDKLSYNVTYFIETYRRLSSDSEIEEGPELLSQKKLLSSLGYVHDKVKFDFFYRTGFQHQILVQSVTTFGEDLRFISIGYEGRQYWKVGHTTNFASQLRMDMSTNNDTPFAPYVLDSNINIRGVGNRVARATAQFVLNLEIRQTIFDNKNFAVQLVAFSDSGTWRQPGADFDTIFQKESFRSFVGGGARFILPKVLDAVLRLDYGINLYDSNSHGLALGFGQFF